MTIDNLWIIFKTTLILHELKINVGTLITFFQSKLLFGMELTMFV